MSTALLKAIKIAGSRRNLAKAIGTTPDAINGWLNRGISVPLQYAIEIERFSFGEISWTEIAPHLAHFAKLWIGYFVPIHTCTIHSIHVALACIKCKCSISPFQQSLYTLSNDIKQNGLQCPICVSTENELIFGAKRLYVYERLGKKTIPAWRISLYDLICGKYSTTHLCQIFTLSERISISLAAEKCIGNRQGRRKNELFRENFPEIKGRIDEFLANLLDFGNPKTYQQAKKICQCGCHELIDAIDQQQIAISSAALLAQLSHIQQKYILTHSDKEIASYVRQLRNQK